MFLQDEDDEDQNHCSQWGTVYKTANKKEKGDVNKKSTPIPTWGSISMLRCELGTDGIVFSGWSLLVHWGLHTSLTHLRCISQNCTQLILTLQSWHLLLAKLQYTFHLSTPEPFILTWQVLLALSSLLPTYRNVTPAANPQSSFVPSPGSPSTKPPMSYSSWDSGEVLQQEWQTLPAQWQGKWAPSMLGISWPILVSALSPSSSTDAVCHTVKYWSH